MPLDFQDFKREIESKGYSTQSTRKGHYWVITPTGGKLITFAVTHRKNSRGDVLDAYVSRVRRAISNDSKVD